MLISLNWIKEYVDLPSDKTADQLAHDLTMSTVEVEQVIDQAKDFEHMVVGKIVEIRKHPNADKLKVVMTDIGSSVKQIVCGGSNLREGMLVAVALPGSRVRWHGEGELVQLEKTSIRGEESFGMICASAEINLAEQFPAGDEREILDVSFLDAKPGDTLADSMGFSDIVLEIDNKSLTNRPDLWGHYGMAREFAALYDLELKPLLTAQLPDIQEDELSITIDTKDCNRYIGLVIDNIVVEPSPAWLQERLLAAGMRPINVIVDLTNYVMLETSQPLHAFDYATLAKGKLIVRDAKHSETLVTLEGEERKLTKDLVVIADKKHALAVAGVKGGADSGITEQTTKIVLESANFNPVVVRKATQVLQLRTDASQRHDKGLSLETTAIGATRFVELLHTLYPEASVTNVVDEGNKIEDTIVINTSSQYITKRLGQDLSVDDMTKLLARLGFEVTSSGDKMVITVPHWRATGDVSIPADIVEEVGRMYGYDNLSFQPPQVALTHAVYQPRQFQKYELKSFLSKAAGLHEIYSYPWADEQLLEQLGVDTKDLIELAHPPAHELRFLQKSLLPNMLTAVQKNTRFFDSFGLYEVADVFNEQTRNDTKRTTHLCIAVVRESAEQAFHDCKGIIVSVLDRFRPNVFTAQPVSESDLYDTKAAIAIMQNSAKIATCGVLQKAVRDTLNIPYPVAVVEAPLEVIVTDTVLTDAFVPVAKYPTVERDIAVEVDYTHTWQHIKDAVRGSDPLILSVTFLSHYDLENKKSIAFRVEYGAADRTLESAEVEQVEQTILAKLSKQFDAILRK